jgi:small subunit ribosomal protein S6
MLIVRPDVLEESLEQLLTAQKTFLQENGAQDLEMQIRGKRRFTFELKRFKEGLYVQMNYQAEPSTVALWEKGMRINESILRFMTLRRDQD